MSDSLDRLDVAFFQRDSLVVAPELIGRYLRRDEVVLQITEVEAYRGPSDSACHAKAGLTKRTEPLFGPPGRAYVYLCYGIHQMLNLVTGPEGHCVLIRACEPVSGHDEIARRRGNRTGPQQLAGPGRVGRALLLDASFNHHPLTEPGGLEVLTGCPVAELLIGPRVGIDYAEPEHRDASWRFAMAESPWVSHRQRLVPRR